MIDAEQFVRAVEAASHSMYRAALILLHSEADAKDAVCDAIEAAWRRRESIRAVEALPAYLIRCAVNAAHHQLRRLRRIVPLEPLADTLSTSESDPIWFYLSGLKEKYRLPLLLRYGEGMREQEAARVLGVSRGTVSSLISRGLKQLRTAMEEEAR